MEVSETITVTDEMVRQFAELTGDRNPIHLDDDYASKSIFGKRIVHGMLLGGFISKMIATDYPGEGSIYLNQNLNFKSPCFIGDIITVQIKLIKKERTKYTLDTKVLRKNTILIEGEAFVIKK